MLRKALLLIIKIFQKLLYLLGQPVCQIRSGFYSLYIDGGGGRIVITDPLLRIRLRKGRGAKFTVKGTFRISPHLGGRTPVSILIGNGATLEIGGDFIIGHGVRIFLHHGAQLSFGGKHLESDSGITSDTFIMVHQKVSAGRDFICAWNVFISDSDWHAINDRPHHSPVEIGDHVWIANSVSILRGTRLGDGTIVASHSKVSGDHSCTNCLLAGNPAKTVRTGVSWRRDID